MIIQPGYKNNRLEATKYLYTGKHGRRYFDFKCDCGKHKTLTAEAVISGNTKSCGCLSREVKKAKRLPNDRGIINQIVLQIKRHAKSRGLEWKLKVEDVDILVRKPCRYCGVVGGNIKVNRHNPKGFRYNGIDRINSKKGYIKNNCVACCKICNFAKSNMTLKDFRSWALRLNAMAEQWG